MSCTVEGRYKRQSQVRDSGQSGKLYKCFGKERNQVQDQ